MSVLHEWSYCVWKTQIAPQHPSISILLHIPTNWPQSHPTTHNLQALSMWKVCLLYKLQVISDLTTNEVWSFSWSPLRYNADFWILCSLFSILFCREDEKKKKRVGGRDEVQHRHRLSSSSASLSLHRREGWECTKASQGEASWAWEASWTPLGQQHLWSSELRERNQYREKETDARSPNLALSLQARWPPTHKWSYTLTHIQIHTYIQICYLLHNLTHTLMTTTHLHMHVFVSLVFLEAMLFWRNLYNPNRAQ